MFASRQEAGRLLGKNLAKKKLSRPVVLGITRGGVVVAAEVAKTLKAPLYPLVIKKVSSEFNPEFAVGAVGPAGIFVGEFSEEAAKQVEERIKKYKIPLCKSFAGRAAIIVDDGIATGWTIRAAVQYVTGLHPGRVVVAVPVAGREIAGQLGRKVDRLVILEEVDNLGAVGNFYEDFGQVSDDQVKSCVREVASGRGSRG